MHRARTDGISEVRGWGGSKLLTAPLRPIASFTEHLTVSGDRRSALFPRRNMVTLHLFKLEMLFAKGTYARLALVCFSFLFVVKGAETVLFPP